MRIYIPAPGSSIGSQAVHYCDIDHEYGEIGNSMLHKRNAEGRLQTDDVAGAAHKILSSQSIIDRKPITATEP